MLLYTVLGISLSATVKRMMLVDPSREFFN
jgi:hypothetical protein